jgi:hemerythrin superfamily protein
MKKKSKLQIISQANVSFDSAGVVTLLLKDHRAMRELMEKIDSPRATQRAIFAAYAKLEKLVHSHMKAEEESLLHRLKDHKLFEDKAKEGIEEHRVHELIMAHVHRIKDPERRAIHMHIFCEVLEHHLKEEETKLFPRVQKNIALTTRKKIGKIFAKKRSSGPKP